MVFYDYIEIGTCDFNTEIEKPNNKTGISIEPLKYYFDKLPEKENCIKLNIGISNKEEDLTLYYIDDKIVKKYNLHPDIRGSNSIYSTHKYIHNTIKEINNKYNLTIKYEDIISKKTIKCISLYQLFKNYNIKTPMLLKIDTEGHDKVILNQFLDDIKNNEDLPINIVFESNYLISQYDLLQLYNRFINIGYDLIYKTIDNSILQLNLKKLKNKHKFSEQICGYYISSYPDNYNPNNLPHKNTLEDAQLYCIKHNCIGITYQYERYEVRNGAYLYAEYENKYKDKNLNLNKQIISWIYI